MADMGTPSLYGSRPLVMTDASAKRADASMLRIFSVYSKLEKALVKIQTQCSTPEDRSSARLKIIAGKATSLLVVRDNMKSYLPGLTGEIKSNAQERIDKIDALLGELGIKPSQTIEEGQAHVEKQWPSQKSWPDVRTAPQPPSRPSQQNRVGSDGYSVFKSQTKVSAEPDDYLSPVALKADKTMSEVVHDDNPYVLPVPVADQLKAELDAFRAESRTTRAGSSDFMASPGVRRSNSTESFESGDLQYLQELSTPETWAPLSFNATKGSYKVRESSRQDGTKLLMLRIGAKISQFRFEQKGQSFHIIDGKTGRLSRGYTSVEAIAQRIMKQKLS